MSKKLITRKKGKHYWITGMPRYYVEGKPYTECGPYSTREEANSDKEGMQRTLDKIGWEDCEEPPKETQGRHKKVKSTIVSVNEAIVKVKAKKRPVVVPLEEEGFW